MGIGLPPLERAKRKARIKQREELFKESKKKKKRIKRHGLTIDDRILTNEWKN